MTLDNSVEEMVSLNEMSLEHFLISIRNDYVKRGRCIIPGHVADKIEVAGLCKRKI